MKTLSEVIRASQNHINESVKSFNIFSNILSNAILECAKSNKEIFNKVVDAFYNKNHKLRAEVDDQVVDIVNDYLSENKMIDSDMDSQTLLPIILGWTLYYHGKNKL